MRLIQLFQNIKLFDYFPPFNYSGRTDNHQHIVFGVFGGREWMLEIETGVLFMIDLCHITEIYPCQFFELFSVCHEQEALR